MTGSLNKSAWLLFVLLSSAPAWAAAPMAPHDTGPAIAANDDNSDDDDATKPSISVAPLSKPAFDGFGPLTESNGGFSPALWKDSTRESTDALLQLIHSSVSNDILLSLTTRALMTQATPPAGTGENWFIVRVNALIALAQDEKADQMIASLPSSMINDPLREVHTELLLVRGDADGACRFAGTPPATAADSASAVTTSFWQKMKIFCQARSGKKDEAMLGMDLLREQNQLDDPFFQDGIRKLGDKNATIKSLPKKWTLLDVALIRAAGELDKIKERVDTLPPVAVKYLAQDSTIDIKLHDKLVLRSQQLGIVPIKDTNKLPEQPFTKPLASDVTTLVTALGSNKPANSGDDAVIARLALDEGASVQDCRRVQRLLTFMEPFGYKVPADVWQKLFARKNRFDGDAPPAVLVAQLNDAAQAGRRGDVILLAALIIEGADVDKVSDLALLPVVRALKLVGLEKEARTIAYTAVKAYSGR